MDDTSLQSIKERTVPLLLRAGVVRAGLFGSMVKGNMSENSDVDVLVEFQEEKTLFDLIALKAALEKNLGRKVDLLTYRALSPLLRDRILREHTPLL